jgi:hypothetical protein
MIAIYKRMSGKETKRTVKKLEQWFRDNPRRRVCNAEINGCYVKVRKGSIKEDVVKEIGIDYPK